MRHNYPLTKLKQMRIEKENIKIITNRKKYTEKVNYDFNYIMDLIIHVGNKLMPDKYDSFGKKIEFEINEANKNFYEQMVYYFFNDEKFNGNLASGLHVHGGKGTGKTMFANIFRNLSYNRIITTGKGFNMQYCDAIASEYESKGAIVLQKYYSSNYLFDDLGTENIKANHYQNIRNTMKEILSTRYRLFIDEGLLTYITSNYTQELLASEEKGYGIRVEDRFNEMFNDIKLTGASMRR